MDKGDVDKGLIGDIKRGHVDKGDVDKGLIGDIALKRVCGQGVNRRLVKKNRGKLGVNEKHVAGVMVRRGISVSVKGIKLWK